MPAPTAETTNKTVHIPKQTLEKLAKENKGKKSKYSKEARNLEKLSKTGIRNERTEFRPERSERTEFRPERFERNDGAGSNDNHTFFQLCRRHTKEELLSWIEGAEKLGVFQATNST